MTHKDIPEIDKLIELNNNILSEMKILSLKNKCEHIKIRLKDNWVWESIIFVTVYSISLACHPIRFLPPILHQ